MYEIQWGQKSPGLLVFLIDQSGSMCRKDLHKNVVNAIQDAVFDCLEACVSGRDIKKRFYLLVLGYGDSIKILKEGWISDRNLVDELRNADEDGRSFLDAVADGWTPMDDAFKKTQEYVQKWIKQCNDQVGKGELTGIPAPIVINITDGVPEKPRESQKETEKRTEQEARKLMNITTSDGNVILFNLHLTAEDTSSVQFPREKSELNDSHEAHFLYEISSCLDDRMVSIAKMSGLESARNGSRGMITNASGSVISKFISFGSSVSGVTGKV